MATNENEMMKMIAEILATVRRIENTLERIENTLEDFTVSERRRF